MKEPLPPLPRFTARHADMAEAQGWALIDSGLRGPEIQADDDARVFRSDEDALEYVERQAKRGRPEAVAALAAIERYREATQ